MGVIDARPHLAAETVVAGLVLAAAVPLGRLFEGGGLGAPVFLAVVLSLAVSTVIRRLRMPPILSLAVSLIAMVWWIAINVAPDHLWAIFPGSDALFEVGRTLRAGVNVVIQEVAPVRMRRELLPFIITGVWMTTWLVEAALLWVGSPLLAIAGTFPLFVVPGAIVRAPNRMVAVVPYLIGVAGLLVYSERQRTRRSMPTSLSEARVGWSASASVKMIGAAIVAVVITAPILPGFGDVPGFAGSSGVSGTNALRIDPLVSIKPTLSERDPISVFTVRTVRPTYMRLTALERFDGKAWRPGPVRLEPAEGRIRDSAPDAQSRIQEQTVRMAALRGDWLPAAFSPVEVAAPLPIRVERPTGAIVVDGGLPRGATYSVTSLVPEPTFEDLDVPAVFDDPALRPVLALPAGMPPVIEQIARQVTADQRTPFAKAVALQTYLRTFTYDLNVAAGNSFSTIEDFLTDAKRGYCEQFATAMAVMARTLGIPSRVAIGFGVGRALDGDVYDVTTDEAHAWVELYFPDAGWLPFEPTPRALVAVPPSYTFAPGDPQPPTPSVSPTPTSSTSAAPAPSTTPSASVAPAPGAATTGPVTAWWLALLLVPLGVAGGTRAWARVRTRGLAPAVRRYADLLAWCASAGWVRGASETPAEFSARLGSAVPDVGESATAVARGVESAIWGGDAAAVLPIEQVRATLRAGLSVRRRLLVALGWDRWRPALPSARR